MIDDEDLAPDIDPEGDHRTPGLEQQLRRLTAGRVATSIDPPDRAGAVVGEEVAAGESLELSPAVDDPGQDSRNPAIARRASMVVSAAAGRSGSTA